MSWILTPDQFALVWARTDGDRIPYPLAVRLSARDSVERAAQLAELNAWCDRTLDADLEAALRILGRPDLSIEVFGQGGGAGGPSDMVSSRGASGYGGTRLSGDESGAVRTEVAGRLGGARGQSGPVIGSGRSGAVVEHNRPLPSEEPIRVLGAVAGNIAVVVVQEPGAAPDRGARLRISVGGVGSLAARVVRALPPVAAGGGPRLGAPLDRVVEDGRDLVTVPVEGPTMSTRIRRLLVRRRDGLGQIVVSVHRDGRPRPFGVLCWIDVTGDGRYTVRTGKHVDIEAVTADGFTAALRTVITAGRRTAAYADR
ncbi:ESX secretion-associated protein EspG [Nocardia brevicatena]|uniref:ESX secretion-associated protein EspG n=1 Tax=Nocardia brevicatena TaxID=37327 RepID=UPI0002EFCF7A|nr:ESX secretion-associated protein EspG [Nocardia brevicatena]